MEGKEIDIDFIKWKFGYAEGFEWHIHNMITLPNGKRYVITSDDFSQFIKTWESVFSPLLLQRAIEGINREKPDIGIMMTLEDIGIYHYRDYLNPIKTWPYIEADIDQAKEQALKYIYEQEQK